jgi:type VI secretion system (T6SS) tail sheath-like EvpB family protein
MHRSGTTDRSGAAKGSDVPGERTDRTDTEPEVVAGRRRLRDEIVVALSECGTVGLIPDPVQALAGDDVTAEHMQGFLSAQIAALDALLSVQLGAIVDSTEYRELEATWRGLHYLVGSFGPTPMVRIRVLNVSKDELLQDLEQCVEFDQGRLFTKVYSEALDTWGGLPLPARSSSRSRRSETCVTSTISPSHSTPPTMPGGAPSATRLMLPTLHSASPCPAASPVRRCRRRLGRTVGQRGVGRGGAFRPCLSTSRGG